MPAGRYDEVVARVRELTPEEQRRLLDDLTALVRRPHSRKRSILELEGLGKEIWEGIDAQKYVDGERNSWNG